MSRWAKELNRTPRGGRAVLLVFQVASVLCKRATGIPYHSPTSNDMDLHRTTSGSGVVTNSTWKVFSIIN